MPFLLFSVMYVNMSWVYCFFLNKLLHEYLQIFCPNFEYGWYSWILRT